MAFFDRFRKKDKDMSANPIPDVEQTEAPVQAESSEPMDEMAQDVDFEIPDRKSVV